MAEPEEGVKDLLVAAGVGTFGATSGWGIFIGPEPTHPDTSVTVRSGGGLNPMPKWLVDFPSIQVMVRGAPGDFVNVKAKAREVQGVLHSKPSFDLNGDRWDSILQVGDIAYMGIDESNRPKFSLNFSLIIEPASGANRQPLA